MCMMKILACSSEFMRDGLRIGHVMLRMATSVMSVGRSFDAACTCTGNCTHFKPWVPGVWGWIL